MAEHASQGRELSEGALLAGRYAIQKRLGAGGMGAVYLALDSELGERVALKTLHSDLLDSDVHLERFRREVRLARRITHRNVARTFDIGEDGGLRFLTMEYVPGSSLKQVIRERGQLQYAEGLLLLAQVCDGLAAAHGAGVVHRDLKPANLLIADDGRVVIVDFGVARPLTEVDAVSTMGAIGTPAYMAPEQLSGDPVSPATDLFAVGLILHEVLTGTRAEFSGGSGDQILSRLAGELVDRSARFGLPAELTRLLGELLAQHPARRPTSASGVALRLRTATETRAGADPLHSGELTKVQGPLAPHEAPSVSGFAPLPSGKRLAVLPFVERGEASDALGETLGEELTDLLSRSRGLRVLAARAGARLDDREPGAAGRELGVDVIVEGTVKRQGADVRITARLVEVHSGMQLWSDRFAGRIEDIFDFSDRMAQKIAEALRTEISLAEYRQSFDPAAVELYLVAKRQLSRFDLHGEGGAIENLEHGIALAPTLEPLLALHALALTSTLFLPEQARVSAENAQQSIARALKLAPSIPETHLANALQASLTGDYHRAARALREALAIAPTLASAHDYLGHLQLEAGRRKEGLAHAKTAMDLDPHLLLGATAVARDLLFSGQLEEYERAVSGLAARGNWGNDLMLQTRARAAAWTRDTQALKEIARAWTGRQSRTVQVMQQYCEALAADRPDLSALEQSYAELQSSLASARFRTFISQLLAEAHGCAGNPERALFHAQRAAADALVDLDWLERCPALAGIRTLGDYPKLRQTVVDRAAAIWRT